MTLYGQGESLSAHVLASHCAVFRFFCFIAAVLAGLGFQRSGLLGVCRPLTAGLSLAKSLSEASRYIARAVSPAVVRTPPHPHHKPPMTSRCRPWAVGRTPNGKKLATEKGGITVSDCGFIPGDIQMRTNVSHSFAIGDIVGLHVGAQVRARGACGGRSGRL